MPQKLTLNSVAEYHRRLGVLLDADEKGLLTWHLFLHRLLHELQDDLNYTFPHEEQSND